MFTFSPEPQVDPQQGQRLQRRKEQDRQQQTSFYGNSCDS